MTHLNRRTNHGAVFSQIALRDDAAFPSHVLDQSCCELASIEGVGSLVSDHTKAFREVRDMHGCPGVEEAPFRIVERGEALPVPPEDRIVGVQEVVVTGLWEWEPVPRVLIRRLHECLPGEMAVALRCVGTQSQNPRGSHRPRPDCRIGPPRITQVYVNTSSTQPRLVQSTPGSLKATIDRLGLSFGRPDRRVSSSSERGHGWRSNAGDEGSRDGGIDCVTPLPGHTGSGVGGKLRDGSDGYTGHV
jgi:hypothetical protein